MTITSSSTDRPRVTPKSNGDREQSGAGAANFPNSMKKLVTLLSVVSALSGCARFSTNQTDISHEEGKPIRTITTKATGYTLWSGKSNLAAWKALNTDKSQMATVGGLSQDGGVTNTADIIERAVGAAVKAAIGVK